MSAALALLGAPALLQAAAIGVDEGHFHRERGLARWERVGHPVDTGSVLVAYAFLALVPPLTTARVLAYAAIATLSTLVVTKDEWVHAEHCPPAEHWLHAVLFILHPLVFVALGLAWPALHATGGALGATSALALGCTQGDARLLIFGQLALTSFFFVFQIVYWNGPGSDVRARGARWRRRARAGTGHASRSIS